MIDDLGYKNSVVYSIEAGEDTLVSLLSNDRSKSESGVHRITLEAYGYRWFRVGGLAYILERER